ncbi:GNAT family N-acetyltransferase [Halococcus saccharolyticus]|uniref:Putative acetyltransferase n=1 Tax=Halococcus saccharolyticus DSM 5350 TaxID=1227455 RepID=M0MGU6_9EURY|nr:GNAT family N-acetyltransferase [Halococcus saccharolyticus]EMA44947.1 putative acetyltransferase [Halococcus saccharolyticus DSM 5350]
MIVREAMVDDIDAIEAVARASWETDYPAILSRETAREGVEEWYDADRLAAEIESDDALVPVADGGDGVVGFVHAVEDEAGGTILRLYVAPEHRREGVGGDLLDHTREVLAERGAEQIRAMVLAENEPGNEFYRRHGFELVEESETVIAATSYRENVYVSER